MSHISADKNLPCLFNSVNDNLTLNFYNHKRLTKSVTFYMIFFVRVLEYSMFSLFIHKNIMDFKILKRVPTSISTFRFFLIFPNKDLR